MRRFQKRRSKYWMSLEYFEQRIYLANDLANSELEDNNEPETHGIAQYSDVSMGDNSINNKPTEVGFQVPDTAESIVVEESMEDFTSGISFDAYSSKPYNLIEIDFDHDVGEEFHRCDEIEQLPGYSVATGDPLSVELDGSVIDNSGVIHSGDSPEESSPEDDDTEEHQELPEPGSSANINGAEVPTDAITSPAGQGRSDSEISSTKEQTPGDNSETTNRPVIVAGNTPVSGNASPAIGGNSSMVLSNVTMPSVDRQPFSVPSNKPSELQRFSSLEIGVIVVPDESVAETAEEADANRSEVDPASIPLAIAAISYFPVQKQDNRKKQELRATYSEQSAEHFVETNPIEQLQRSIDTVLTANVFDAIYAEDGAHEAAIVPIAFTIPTASDPSHLKEQIELTTGAVRRNVLAGSSASSSENLEDEDSTDYRPYLSFLMAGFLISLPHTRKLFNQRNKEEKALHAQVNPTLEDSSNS